MIERIVEAIPYGSVVSWFVISFGGVFRFGGTLPSCLPCALVTISLKSYDAISALNMLKRTLWLLCLKNARGFLLLDYKYS